MFSEEKKYYLKSILTTSIASVVSVVVIISLGIYALTYSTTEDKAVPNDNIISQSEVAFKLFSETAFNHNSQINTKISAALENHLRVGSGFRFVPDLSFDDINLENVPSLYFNNVNICDYSKTVQDNFAYYLKVATGAEIMIYQRVNKQGDMYLACHSFYELPDEFPLRFISNSLEKNKKNPIIEKIFNGQTYSSVQNLQGTLYSLNFKRLIDRRGTIVGMIAVLTKLSGALDFDFMKLSEQYYISDKATGRQIYSKIENSDINKYFARWADSLLALNLNENSTFALNDYGRVAYYDSRLNWLISTEIPVARKVMPSGLRENGTKMAFAAGLLVLIIVIFTAIRRSDKFSKKIDSKEIYLNSIIGNILHGKYAENENDFTEKYFKSDESIKLFSNSVFDMLRKINTKISDLEKDKNDLTDILEGKLRRVVNLTDRLRLIKDDSQGLIDNSIDSFTDVTVRITQLSSAVGELSIWDSFNEIASKLQIDSGADVVRDKSKNMKVKAGIVGDKVEKVFAELNAMKKISDHAYLISINSAIFAEKANSNKLAILSDEVKKISENLSNVADQIYYLLSEAKNAVHSCTFDIEHISGIISNSPKQSDIAQMMVEYSKFNEKVTSLSGKFRNLNEECRTVLKTLESGKSSINKNEPIINEFINLAEEL